MRDRIILLAAALLVCVSASLTPAQKAGKAPQGPVGKDKSSAVRLLPDLAVGLKYKPTPISRIATAIVYNKCKGSAPASRVEMQVLYNTEKGGQQFLISMDVPPLGPGEKAEVTFEIPSNHPHLKTLGDKYFTFTADPYNKVKEASEGNNWWKPDATPFPDKGGYCDPPYNS